MTHLTTSEEKQQAARFIESLSTREQVDLLAQALLREYMHRRGFRETLKTFDAENPRDERTISSRAIMQSLLNIPVAGRISRLRPTKGANGKDQNPTFMEELCSYRLTKRSYRVGTAPATANTDTSSSSRGERDPSDVEVEQLKEAVAARQSLKAINDAKIREFEQLLAAEEAHRNHRKERRDGDKKRKRKNRSRHEKGMESPSAPAAASAAGADVGSAYSGDERDDDDEDGDESDTAVDFPFGRGAGARGPSFRPALLHDAPPIGAMAEQPQKTKKKSKSRGKKAAGDDAAETVAVGSHWVPPSLEENQKGGATREGDSAEVSPVSRMDPFPSASNRRDWMEEVLAESRSWTAPSAGPAAHQTDVPQSFIRNSGGVSSALRRSASGATSGGGGIQIGRIGSIDHEVPRPAFAMSRDALGSIGAPTDASAQAATLAVPLSNSGGADRDGALSTHSNEFDDTSDMSGSYSRPPPPLGTSSSILLKRGPASTTPHQSSGILSSGTLNGGGPSHQTGGGGESDDAGGLDRVSSGSSSQQFDSLTHAAGHSGSLGGSGMRQGFGFRSASKDGNAGEASSHRKSRTVKLMLDD